MSSFYVAFRCCFLPLSDMTCGTLPSLRGIVMTLDFHQATFPFRRGSIRHSELNDSGFLNLYITAVESIPQYSSDNLSKFVGQTFHSSITSVSGRNAGVGSWPRSFERRFYFVYTRSAHHVSSSLLVSCYCSIVATDLSDSKFDAKHFQHAIYLNTNRTTYLLMSNISGTG